LKLREQFVYGVLREYMLVNSSSQPPSPRQILDMVLLKIEGVITKEILKSILQVDQRVLMKRILSNLSLMLGYYQTD
jgi:hypothetical protein